MMMSDQDTFQAVVGRQDLSMVLRGHRPPSATLMRERGASLRLSKRDALVIWSGPSQRPCAIYIGNDDYHELFAWLYTFHRDLVPITSWCHVLPVSEMGRLGASGSREADLVGFEAAWTGAIIAEAMILSQRSFEDINLASCFATESYAIGRTAALYGAKAALSEPLDQLEMVRARSQRSGDNKARLRARIGTEVLLRLLPDAPPPPNGTIALLVEACRSLSTKTHSAVDDPELSRLFLDDISARVPELSLVGHLSGMSAEDRVRLLRHLRSLIATVDPESRQVLVFLAGYVLSRIGGAERDLRLAETFASAHDEVLTWATILGGLGVETYWTDAFNGIGRLVSRELLRPFRLADSPTCDIAVDEFLVLESGEPSPRSKFRTSSRNVAMLALRAGVVVNTLISEDDRGRQRTTETRAAVPPTSGGGPNLGSDTRSLQQLAEQLLPYMRPLISAEVAKLRQRKASKKASPRLPLDE